MSHSRIDVAAQDGVIDAYFVTPEGGGPFPAVVLLSDIRGSRPTYDAMADRLARSGYAVLLPNLYHRGGRAPHIAPGQTMADAGVGERLRGHRAALTPEALQGDFAALTAFLDASPQVDARRIGVVGYCMSGAFALRFAAQFPDRVRAAASFHGGDLARADDAQSPHLLAPRIKARLYIGHADQDASAPPDQIARLDGALAAAGVEHVAELYEGALHGFAITDAAAYNARASEDHWTSLLGLFAGALEPAA